MRGKKGMKFQDGGDMVPLGEHSPRGMFVDYIGAPSTFRARENGLEDILAEYKIKDVVPHTTQAVTESKPEEKREESFEERLRRITEGWGQS